MRKLYLLLFVFISSPLWGQYVNPVENIPAGSPPTPCTQKRIYVDGTNKVAYGCSTTNVPFAFGGGAGGLQTNMNNMANPTNLNEPLTGAGGNINLSQVGGITATGIGIATPAAPSVVATCSGTCTTQWTYAGFEIMPNGSWTALSPPTTITNGAATLSATKYNTITLTCALAGDSYVVYVYESGVLLNAPGNLNASAPQACGTSYKDEVGAGDGSVGPLTTINWTGSFIPYSLFMTNPAYFAGGVQIGGYATGLGGNNNFGAGLQYCQESNGLGCDFSIIQSGGREYSFFVGNPSGATVFIDALGELAISGGEGTEPALRVQQSPISSEPDAEFYAGDDPIFIGYDKSIDAATISFSGPPTSGAGGIVACLDGSWNGGTYGYGLSLFGTSGCVTDGPLSFQGSSSGSVTLNTPATGGQLNINGPVSARDPTYGSAETSGPSACETNYGASTWSSGTTITTGLSCLPANALIKAVVYRITTTISGGTVASFTIGITGTASKFCTTQSTLTAGTTGICTAQWGTAGNQINGSAAPVLVTFNSAPTQGALRLIVYYENWTPPTS